MRAHSWQSTPFQEERRKILELSIFSSEELRRPTDGSFALYIQSIGEMPVHNEQSIQSRLDFIGIDQATRASLRELQPLIAAALPAILDQFYAHVTKYPEIAKLFSSEAAIRHAKEAQIKHWMTISAASFDSSYVQSVTRIGQAHNRLGLEPRWYIAGYSMIVSGLLREIGTQTAQGWFAGERIAGKTRRAAGRHDPRRDARHGSCGLGLSRRGQRTATDDGAQAGPGFRVRHR